MSTYQDRAAYIAAYPPPVESGGMSSTATVLHLIMSILTVGLWIPVWVIHSIVVSNRTLAERKRSIEYWNHVNKYFD